MGRLGPRWAATLLLFAMAVGAAAVRPLPPEGAVYPATASAEVGAVPWPRGGVLLTYAGGTLLVPPGLSSSANVSVQNMDAEGMVTFAHGQTPEGFAVTLPDSLIVGSGAVKEVVLTVTADAVVPPGTSFSLPITATLHGQSSSVSVPVRVEEDVDLVPSALVIGPTQMHFEGQTLFANASVENRGRSASPACTVTFLLDGLSIGEADLPPILPSGSTTVSRAFSAGAGDHMVSLLVDAPNVVLERSEANNRADASFEVTPSDQPLAMAVADPVDCLTGERVFFYGGGSVDPSHAAFDPAYPASGDLYDLNYTWEFGDGSFGYGVSVLHAYADDGLYPVLLTVRAPDGRSDADAIEVAVHNRPPVIVTSATPRIAVAGHPVRFDASGSYDTDGLIVGVLWVPGDGTDPIAGISADHVYAAPGVYDLLLEVRDDDDARAQAHITLTVIEATPPSVRIHASADEVLTGEEVTFVAEVEDPEGGPFSYYWDLGEGEAPGQAVMTVSWPNDGRYEVRLRVEDDMGLSATADSSVAVRNRPPIPSMKRPQGQFCIGSLVVFDGSPSRDPDGEIVRWTWSFGDGKGGEGAFVTHVFESRGTFAVTLTVEDDDGANATVSLSITMENRPPEAFLTVSCVETLTLTPVAFDGSGSRDADGAVVAYRFDFGDGTVTDWQREPNASHAYTDDGIFIPILCVLDDAGAEGVAEALRPIRVSNRPPIAPALRDREAVVFTPLSFTAANATDPDGVVHVSWEFGDGSGAVGVVQSHAWTRPGVYRVLLTVVDDDGASDNATCEVRVLASKGAGVDGARGEGGSALPWLAALLLGGPFALGLAAAVGYAVTRLANARKGRPSG